MDSTLWVLTLPLLRALESHTSKLDHFERRDEDLPLLAAAHACSRRSAFLCTRVSGAFVMYKSAASGRPRHALYRAPQQLRPRWRRRRPGRFPCVIGWAASAAPLGRWRPQARSNKLRRGSQSVAAQLAPVEEIPVGRSAHCARLHRSGRGGAQAPPRPERCSCWFVINALLYIARPALLSIGFAAGPTLRQRRGPPRAAAHLGRLFVRPSVCQPVCHGRPVLGSGDDGR